MKSSTAFPSFVISIYLTVTVYGVEVPRIDNLKCYKYIAPVCGSPPGLSVEQIQNNKKFCLLFEDHYNLYYEEKQCQENETCGKHTMKLRSNVTEVTITYGDCTDLSEMQDLCDMRYNTDGITEKMKEDIKTFRSGYENCAEEDECKALNISANEYCSRCSTVQIYLNYTVTEIQHCYCQGHHRCNDAINPKTGKQVLVGVITTIALHFLSFF